MTAPVAAPDRPAAGSGGRRRALPIAVAAGCVVVAAGVAVATGERTPSVIADPGLAVRLADPVFSAIGNLAAAITVGALVLVTVALPTASPAAELGRRIAAGCGVVWALAWTASAITTYAVASGTPPTDPGFGAGLELFLTSFEAGRYAAAGILLAAAAATAAVAATGPGSTAAATLLALAALVPPALAGHSGSAANHETATTSMGLHLVGVSVWVGGLVALGLVRSRLGEARDAVVARYSGLALVAAGLVLLSGALNSSTRVTGPADLVTPYGALLLAKTALTAALVGAGAVHRRWTIRAMAGGRPAAFRRLLAGEALVMSAVIGVAAALASTVPPVPTTDAPPDRTPGEVVAGYPVPPEPDVLQWVTGWQPDLLWLVLGGAAALGYLAGYRRLRRRGDRWPMTRLVLFLAGIALLTWVTSGGPAVYGRWTFSTHMIQHMLLAMAVPVLLVGGAPVLLALRALRPRRDGSRGAREWLLAAVHSPWSRLVTHPAVAAAIFVVGMVVFYYSPLFELSLRTHLGHELMITHFLASGYLFAWVLVGVDPGTRAIAYPLKLVLLFVTVAFHAFFGVALGQGERLLAADYFTVVAADLPWGPDLLADQRLGAAWAWSLGELPVLVLAVAVAVQWARSDAREARRGDRAADRDGDSAHEAYNAYLARLAAGTSASAAAPDGTGPGRRGRDAPEA